MINAYFIDLLTTMGIFLILALSLQVAMGFTGLFSMGHIAFYGVGAYTSALLSLSGVPFWISFLAAGIMAMLFGFLISLPTKRLKRDYMALASLGFSFGIYTIILNWTKLTGGTFGLLGIPKPILFGYNFSNNWHFLVLTLSVMLISYIVIRRIVHSPFGKVLEAIRDDELAARALGKNTFRIKAFALTFSAFFAGIAGSLYVHYISYIDPFTLTFTQLIPVFLIVIIGGLASLEGTIVATVILILLPEPLKFIGFSPALIGPMRQIIYAFLLLLILIYKPKGLYGRIELD